MSPALFRTADCFLHTRCLSRARISTSGIQIVLIRHDDMQGPVGAECFEVMMRLSNPVPQLVLEPGSEWFSRARVALYDALIEGEAHLGSQVDSSGEKLVPYS